MTGYETASIDPGRPASRKNGHIAGVGTLGRLREELQARLRRMENLTGGPRRPTSPKTAKFS